MGRGLPESIARLHQSALSRIPGALPGGSTRMRLRSDFWVSAHLRRLGVEGIPAVLRRRGSPEAGAIFVKVDRLDGTADLYGPAPQALFEAEDSGDRRFTALITGGTPLDIEERLTKEIRFDSDLWIIEIDTREGRHFLELAE
jgi:hypothetical protein